MAQLNFNANEVAPDMGVGDPLPEGWYNVMIDNSEIKPTKDNATTGGCLLNLQFAVIDGQCKGRKLFSRFNIRNANPVAQEIAYKQLSAVAHAVGVLMVQDSQQLHGIPLKVRVKIKGAQLKDKNDPNGEKYEATNEITAYKNINEVVAAPATSAPPGGFPAPAPGGFAGFAAPPPTTPAPAAPNPAQWAAPQGVTGHAPVFQGYQAPEQQFAAPAPQVALVTPPPQFAAPQHFAPPQFAAPAPAPAPAPVTPQFAAPAQASVATAAPVAPAQNATPPWARTAA